jgi:hypothetical protein
MVRTGGTILHISHPTAWPINSLSVFSQQRQLLLMSGLVLLVADLLHPVDDLAVELFLNGDMGHGRGRHGAMPMLLTRRASDHVTRSNHLDWTAPALYEAAARRHDQGSDPVDGYAMQCGHRARR